MEENDKETDPHSGPLCNPDGGHRTSRVPSPPRPCSCHDHCDGDYGGPHCNADIGDDIDALIAATRANPSTATYLDLPRNRLACYLDGDTNGDDGSDRDDCDNAAPDTRA